MLALPYRILIAVLYGFAGVVLMGVVPFWFTPWEWQSWSHLGVVIAWVVMGVALDPFRFASLRRTSPLAASWFGRFVHKWPLLVLSVLMLAPIIAWTCRFGWFFPWLPWWSLAPYWIARELILAGAFAIIVPIIWPALSFGRLLALLIGLLLLNHVVLLLTYAGMSGTREYLQDGTTQDCFLVQLWFKLAVGIAVFFGSHFWSRKRATKAGQQTHSG